ncbi:MAG: response regulator, partial [Thermodesulfobacteriota bacterium]|nr:response regulator [Thermodesulfobacteriota bacterium]
PDYKPEDKPEGHICFDVIQAAGDDMLIVRDLQNTPYAETDPNVRAYHLQTYVGTAVKCCGETVGSHCVVFQSDFIPSEQDRKVLELAASAMGVEEERLRVDRALRDSEERYRSFVENIDLGVSLIDSDHNIVHMNTAHGKMYDKPESLFLGKKCFQALRKQASVCPDCPGVRAMATGQAARIEAEGVRDDGTTFTAMVHAFPAFGPDKEVAGFIQVMEDVTEQRRLEAQLQQAQKMKSIGTLAGGIAHDFNNLLMGIQGNVSLMLMHLDSTHPHYERLRRIDRQVESGARLTAHLLGYARKGRYEIRPLDLGQLVEETVETFGRTRKDISIHRSFARDLHIIEADRGQIEQVLLNVFINAGDAMPDGGQLTLRVVNTGHLDMGGRLYEPKPGQYVLLTVSDTGTGMDEKTQARIFEPFFTTKEMGRGTGLGMASAYGIIKGHGGYIDVHSRPGEGTTFNIYLPASLKGVGHDARPIKMPPTGSETVLLVDDEEQIRGVGQEMLEAMGYGVLLARDGREAIELYRHKQDEIDIVLLDIVMPNMGGGETYDKLKEIDPAVKVLLFSGYSIDVKATEILDRGCDGFIQKPFRAKELSAKLREILDA